MKRTASEDLSPCSNTTKREKLPTTAFVLKYMSGEEACTVSGSTEYEIMSAITKHTGHQVTHYDMCEGVTKTHITESLEILRQFTQEHLGRRVVECLLVVHDKPVRLDDRDVHGLAHSGNKEEEIARMEAVHGPISGWDVSFVTDMSCLFKGARNFCGDLSEWVVSSVTCMRSMFSGAVSFNGNLSTWKVHNVTDTSYMFWGAVSFNCDRITWKVHKCD
jgi:hypothetical protein